MAVYVALLRGINVGGQRKIGMESLRESFEALGFSNVKTYIQSGNIIFESAVSDNERLTRRIEGMILRDFGFPVTAVIRSADEMARIVRDNPFLKSNSIDPSKLHLAFLSSIPSRAFLPRVGMLNTDSDQSLVVGREVHLHCQNGFGQTKLSNKAIEKALSVQPTTRNWNTVNVLTKVSADQKVRKQAVTAQVFQKSRLTP